MIMRPVVGLVPRCVLYLDIDGVLNDDEWIRSAERERAIQDAGGGFSGLLRVAEVDIRPHLAARVRRIVEETACVVVLCSSWRIHHAPEQLRGYLEPHGIPVHGVTRLPRGMSDHGHRVAAILEHAASLPPGTPWCVLDDAVDAADVGGRCVTPDDGVTDEDADRVIAILRGTLAP